MTVESQLDQIEASGLIRIAAIHPELEYLFRHWLVQEAAYTSLLKRERKKLHLLVGETLEKLYPERRLDLAAELALHFEEAGQKDQALPYLIEAGQRAFQRYAIHESRGFLDRAQRLLPEEGEEPELLRRRIQVALGRVKAGWMFNPPEGELATLERVLAAAESLGDQRALVEIYSWIALVRQAQGELYGTSAELTHAIDRANHLSEALGDQSLRAQPLSILGAVLIDSGQLRAGATILEEAYLLLEDQGRSIDAGYALDALTFAYSVMGEFVRAEEISDRALRLAERGDPMAKVDARLSRATLELFRGNLEEATKFSRWCVDQAADLGMTSCSIGSNFTLGAAYLQQGKPEMAKPPLQRSGELSQVSYKFWQPLTQAFLSAAEAMLGNVDEARRGWQEALEKARTMGNRFVEALTLWMRAGVLSSMPNPDWLEIISDLDKAIQVFVYMEARPFVARALRDKGHALSTSGKLEPGRAALLESAELFEAMGLGPEAKALREELGSPQGGR